LRLPALAFDGHHEFAGAAEEFAQLRFDGFGLLQGIDDGFLGGFRVGFARPILGLRRGMVHR